MSVFAGPADWWTDGTNAGRTHIATKGIVQSGLILNLDAGVSSSYPGTGTTWTDLSGNGRNGTLTNGPTFDSVNGGSLSFDGTDDYVDVGTASTLFPGPSITTTVEFWCNPGTVNVNDVYVGIQNPSGTRLYIGNYSGLWDLGFGDYPWNGSFTGTRGSVELKWTNLCLVISSGSAKLFVNTRETITKTTDTTVSLSGNFSIGGYLFQGSPDSANMGPSKISNFKVYNRALSAAEIQQNFNALRGRFGI